MNKQVLETPSCPGYAIGHGDSYQAYTPHQLSRKEEEDRGEILYESHIGDRARGHLGKVFCESGRPDAIGIFDNLQKKRKKNHLIILIQ